MKASFPYTYVPNALRKFLKDVPNRAIPPRVDRSYLKSIGLKNNNDYSIVSPLKFVSLLDSGGVPTSEFKAFRDTSNGPIALGDQIRSGYRQLYDVYDDAHKQSDEKLKDFFRANTTVGATAINLIVATFKAFCEYAEFGAGRVVKSPTESALPLHKNDASPSGYRPQLHVNVQIHLPESKDSTTYELIFEAFAKALKKYS